MDTLSKEKEVYFVVYCPRCQHWLKFGTEEPCNECLHHPNNTNSHKPINFKEKETEQNGKENF